MDQNSLVTEHIHEGQNLVDQCIAEGVDVTAAFWIKLSEDGQWYLYIATRVVEDKGLAAAFKAVYGALQRMSTSIGLDSLEDLKVIGATNPITANVLDIQTRYGAPLATRYRGNQLGKISIQEAYLYPPRPVAQPSV